VPRIGTLPLAMFVAWGPPSWRPGATSPISTGHQYRDDRFSCSLPAPATSSRHLYTGHHQGHTQAAPWLGERQDVPLSRGGCCPGFDVIIKPFDASAVVYTRSSSRRIPDPLIADLFRSRFPPRLLTGMTLRRFGLSACTASPEDLPPSLARHGSCRRSSTSPIAFRSGERGHGNALQPLGPLPRPTTPRRMSRD
jgi:hypothetical protein